MTRDPAYQGESMQSGALDRPASRSASMAGWRVQRLRAARAVRGDPFDIALSPQ